METRRDFPPVPFSIVNVCFNDLFFTLKFYNGDKTLTIMQYVVSVKTLFA
jgi:hypothetical protein